MDKYISIIFPNLYHFERFKQKNAYNLPPPFVIFWIFPHISIIYILLFYQISDFLLFFICTFLLFSHFTHFRQIKVNDMHVFIIHINVYVLFIIFHSCSNFGCFKYQYKNIFIILTILYFGGFLKLMDMQILIIFPILHLPAFQMQ